MHFTEKVSHCLAFHFWVVIPTLQYFLSVPMQFVPQETEKLSSTSLHSLHALGAEVYFIFIQKCNMFQICFSHLVVDFCTTLK